MSDGPLVSVFLPTYNQEHFIGEAIDSALNQDYQNLEIVVGDDCSQDGTWDVVKEYQQRFPDKIRAFRNKENLGVTGNCNQVLKRCTGKYIAFHAGDDVFLPTKVSRQVCIMEQRSECVLCYHDVEVFDSVSDETIRFWNTGENGTSPVEGACRDVAVLLVEKGTSFMGALGVMVRRNALPPHGYDWRLPVASDWLMWIDVCASNQGEVAYLNQVLSRYRRHETNITGQAMGDDTDQLVTLALVEARYSWLRRAVRRARGYYFYKQAVSAIKDGKYLEGRRRLVQGVRTSQYSWKWFGWWLYAWFKQLYSQRVH